MERRGGFRSLGGRDVVGVNQEVRDQNGAGRWSAEQVIARYHEHAARLQVAHPRDLRPETYDHGGVRWVFPIMKQVIVGIEAQDLASAQIGVEFLEMDQSFTFGAILKSNCARALRRFAALTDEQIARIRRRVVTMYATGIVPREFAQYLRLLRRVGVGSYWAAFQDAEPKNRFATAAREWIRKRFDRHGQPLASVELSHLTRHPWDRGLDRL
jgi:hypothetical protein